MAEEANLVIQEINQVGMEATAQINAATQAYIGMGHPKPKRVMVNAGHIVTRFGPDVIFQLTALIGAAYISANRIGILMEISQANMIAKFNQSNVEIGIGGSTAAFRYFAMAAFEGALIAAGLYEGQKMTEKKQDPFAERTAFAVTAIGGFMATITLQNGSFANDIAYYTGWVFSIISAVAASIVVRFTAKNMGFLWSAILSLQETFDKEWNKKLDEWKDGFEGFFPEFKEQNYGNKFRKKLQRLESNPADPNTPAPTPPPTNGNGLTGRVREYLVARGFTPEIIGDGPGQIKIVDISNDLNLSKDERNQIHPTIKRMKEKFDAGKPW